MLLRSNPRNEELPQRVMLVLLAALAASGPGSTSAEPELPAEYLAPDHPAWNDVEHLFNRAGLDELPLFTRPLARSDLAAALVKTLSANPALSGSAPARRLQRELAFELERLGEPNAFRETPPFLELDDDDGVVRAQLESFLAASFTKDEGEILEGTAASLTIRAYLKGRVFGLTQVGIEKILDSTPLGDAVVKGSDWYPSTSSAYLSVRTDAIDLAGGLFRHRWGPGSSGTLLLSDAALSYPSLFYAKTFGGRGRFIAQTGALHFPERRWFSAHRFEVVLGRKLRVGLHEAAAYRSEGLDPLYAVGLVPYSLVQRFHDRTADENTRPHRNNVFIGADVAWRIVEGVRMDAELLVDDLTTETSTQPHRLAFQAGLSWSGNMLGSTADARAEFVKVYRYTYAVFYGANLIHDGTPLGYVDGPDAEHYELFAERDFGLDVRAGAGVDLTRNGEGTPGEFWVPADAQSAHAASVLSGTVETAVFPHLRVRATWRDVAWLAGRLGALRIKNPEHRNIGWDTELHGEVELRTQW
jgi:hypothetical protein